MTVKEKLEAYRRKKRREETMKSIKSIMRNIFTWNRENGVEKSIEESTKEERVKLCEQSVDVEENVQEEDVQKEQESRGTMLNRVIYLLYFFLWATLYVIALEYEFGAVYFVLSALLFVCLNTRSGPKQRGEPSAYSVFNPNCEAIEGTLDASQFEKEIRYGIGVAR